MSYLSARNERKNRRLALVYTILITASLIAAVFFADHLADIPDLIKETIWPTEEVVPVEGAGPVARV